ncbi:DUF202 domain-containing protein [Candidatus Kaiserbacteria bacterium]|nr:DUF202 domain-containing protein [Candidatus Kaiserbacteria bacterium]
MSKEKSSMRNDLARERTELANQRTLLAYGRTSLGLFAVAIFVFRFASTDTARILGPLSLTAALFVMLWGLWSFRSTSERVNGKPKRKGGVFRSLSILSRLMLAPRRHTDDID